MISRIMSLFCTGWLRPYLLHNYLVSTPFLKSLLLFHCLVRTLVCLVSPVASCTHIYHKIRGILYFLARFWVQILQMTTCYTPIYWIAPLPHIFLIYFEQCIFWVFGDGMLKLGQGILYVLCHWYVHGTFFNTSPKLTHNIDYVTSQWKFGSTFLITELDMSHVLFLHISHQSFWPLRKM